MLSSCLDLKQSRVSQKRILANTIVGHNLLLSLPFLCMFEFSLGRFQGASELL
jgi:hypothetical protein